MFSEKSEILFNNPLGHGYYNIGLACSPGFLDAVPGQFVMLGLGDRISPLLRRPFSIHRLIENHPVAKGIELLYKAVGTSTRVLSQYKPGDTLEILGPLGTGFEIPEDIRTVFIVSGGIGVAPLVFLSSLMKKMGAGRFAVEVFLGGGSRHDLVCTDDFLDLAGSVHLTTDDGSLGDQCLVTHPLGKSLQNQRPDMVYACGPMGMLRCVMDITLRYEIPCQVSIETMMACGMGVCLGCAMETPLTKDRYLHACKDGPVFYAQMIQRKNSV